MAGRAALTIVGVVPVPLLVGPGGVPVARQQALAGRRPARGPVVVEDDDAEVGVLPAGHLDHHRRLVGWPGQPEMDVDAGRVLDVLHHLPADGVELGYTASIWWPDRAITRGRRLLDVLGLAGPLPGDRHRAGPFLHRGAAGRTARRRRGGPDPRGRKPTPLAELKNDPPEDVADGEEEVDARQPLGRGHEQAAPSAGSMIQSRISFAEPPVGVLPGRLDVEVGGPAEVVPVETVAGPDQVGHQLGRAGSFSRRGEEAGPGARRRTALPPRTRWTVPSRRIPTRSEVADAHRPGRRRR